MTATAQCILEYSRPFTDEEHITSYENRMLHETDRQQLKQSLGITSVQHVSPDGLREEWDMTGPTAWALQTYFEDPYFADRWTWLANFSIQQGNFITLNDPISTIREQ